MITDARDDCRTITLKQAAAQLGISYDQALRLARRDEIPGLLRLGHSWLVSRSALDRALGEHA